MAEDQNAESSRFWEVVNRASKDVEGWDEWKKTYAYAAYPESDFGDQTETDEQTVECAQENERE